MQAHTVTETLDCNGHFPITIHAAPDGGQIRLRAEVDLSYATNPRFQQNIHDLLTLKFGNFTDKLWFKREGNKLLGEVAIEPSHLSEGIKIQINNTPVGNFRFHNEQLIPVAHYRDYQLIVDETRMLSFPMTAKQLQKLPYPRDYVGHLNAQRQPITDLHTHLSSQISSEELLEMGIKHGLSYPQELLDEMGIDYSGLTLHPLDAFRFDPAINAEIAKQCEISEEPKTKRDLARRRKLLTGPSLADLKAKKPESFRKLTQMMAIPVDQVYGPDDFDTYFYRFRNPLEKNPVLAHDKIMQVAKTYHDQGIEYAELSTGAMLDPNWLAEAIPSIEQAEKAYGVKLRLLVGVPRSSPPHKVARIIEKLKFVAQCPYIVGVDFLGFESNKTGDFSWAIYNLARWARRLRSGKQESDEVGAYKDEFVLRVHAGENSENKGNVEEAIDIASNFRVPMRIGHAIYAEVTPELLDKARNCDVTMEFIPNSNIALNNANYPDQIPIKAWADAGIPYVLGSDGAGAYQTTTDQLARSALFAGLTPKDLQEMQNRERQYIQRRDTIFVDKRDAFNERYKDVDSFVSAYRDFAKKVDRMDLPPRYNNKTPILIAGASGSSWRDIAPEHQEEIRIAMRMMVDMLDPRAVYFDTGRTKGRGIEKELDIAIDKHEERDQNWRKEPPFDMIANVAIGDGPVSIANGVTWVNAVSGKPQSIVPHVVDFMLKHAYQKDPSDNKQGCYAMFAGGKVLTSEYIRQARKKLLPHGLMKGPEGAANEQSDRAAPDDIIAATHGRSLAQATLHHMLENLGPNVFKEKYREAFLGDESSIAHSIKQCYAEQKKIVANEAAPSTQVESVERIVGKGKTRTP